MEVAGKTGTAQNWRRDERNVKVDDNHTWFISFAPYKSPKFAVCVLVQNGKSGGGVAAPVARRVLEQCLALENGYNPIVEALPPAVGHFKHIPQIQYADAGVPVLPVAADEDGDTGVGAPTAEPEETTAPRSSATPNIKRKADSSGSAGSNSEQNSQALPKRRIGIFNRSSQNNQPSESSPSGGGLFRRLFNR